MSSAAPRTRKMGLLIATEGASPGVDPSADGSGYTRVSGAEEISFVDETEVIETNYATNRNFPTESEVGAGGASGSFKTPITGLASAAGDGVNASTVGDDYLDLLLTHTFGQQTTTAGEGVTASASSTTIEPAADVYGVHDLLPVYEAGVPNAVTARTQWASVVSEAAGVMTVDPPFQNHGTLPPTSSAIIYGVKTYRVTDAGGNTLAVLEERDAQAYMYLMGRVNSLSISGADKKRVMASWGMAFDSSSADDIATKTAIPSAARQAVTPIKHLLSPVFFNGNRIPTKSCQVDFGIAAQEVGDSQGANGRGDMELVSIAPTVTIEPLHTEAYREFKRAGAKGRLLVQFGGGVLSGGVLNTVAIQFERTEAREISNQDDNGMNRQSIKFHAVDAVELSTGVDSIFMQLARG